MKQERKRECFLVAGAVAVGAVVLGAAVLFSSKTSTLKNTQAADSVLEEDASSAETVEKVSITDDELSQLISGDITLDSIVQEAGEIEFESDPAADPTSQEEAAGSEQAAQTASSQQSAASSKVTQKPESASSSGKTQMASSATEPTQPAEPAGYEAELKALIQQVYAVKARGENGLNASIEAAKAEYKALPESQQTQTRKVMIVLSKAGELNALQSSCDKEMDSIVSQMRTLLQENGQSTTLADQVMEAYKAEKSSRYTELKNKLYS